MINDRNHAIVHLNCTKFPNKKLELSQIWIAGIFNNEDKLENHQNIWSQIPFYWMGKTYNIRSCKGTLTMDPEKGCGLPSILIYTAHWFWNSNGWISAAAVRATMLKLGSEGSVEGV